MGNPRNYKSPVKSLTWNGFGYRAPTMKKLIALAGILVALASSASAVPFQFRYTFTGGGYIEGEFDGEPYFADTTVLDIVYPGNITASFYQTKSSPPIFLSMRYFDYSIPINGSMDGLLVAFNDDNGGPDEGFSLQEGFVSVYWVKDKTLPQEQWEVENYSEPITRRWQLTSIYSIPEGGAGLLLISVVTAGLLSRRNSRI